MCDAIRLTLQLISAGFVLGCLTASPQQPPVCTGCKYPRPENIHCKYNYPPCEEYKVVNYCSDATGNRNYCDSCVAEVACCFDWVCGAGSHEPCTTPPCTKTASLAPVKNPAKIRSSILKVCRDDKSAEMRGGEHEHR